MALRQARCRIASGCNTNSRRASLWLSPTSICLGEPLRTSAFSSQAVDVDRDACSASCSDVTDRAKSQQLTSVSNRTADVPLCSRSAVLGNRAAIVAVASSLYLLLVNAAWASGGTLSGGAFDLFKSFLDHVESMGPAGYLVFVLVVMVSEMIPLFPTQPLSLASGLIFGGKQGAVLMLAGVTLAAINAFIISRGIGRPLAEKVIRMEMGEEPGDSPSAASHNAVARKLSEVTRVIETGSFGQQLLAVALLRLTPVVPFSASNYVLGLTPLQLPAFVAGTVAGMAVWSVLYASLGGAGRNLLESGVDLGTVFAELADRSTTYTRPVLLAAGGVAGAVALVYLVSSQLRGGRGRDGGDGDGGGASGGGGAGGAPSSARSPNRVPRSWGGRLPVEEEQLVRK